MQRDGGDILRGDGPGFMAQYRIFLLVVVKGIANEFIKRWDGIEARDELPALAADVVIVVFVAMTIKSAGQRPCAFCGIGAYNL